MNSSIEDCLLWFVSDALHSSSKLFPRSRREPMLWSTTDARLGSGSLLMVDPSMRVLLYLCPTARYIPCSCHVTYSPCCSLVVAVSKKELFLSLCLTLMAAGMMMSAGRDAPTCRQMGMGRQQEVCVSVSICQDMSSSKKLQWSIAELQLKSR